MKTQKQHKNNKSIFGILLALVFVTLVYFSQIYPGNSAAQQGDLSLVPSLNNLIKPELTLEIASTNMETPEKPGLDLSEVTPMVTVVKDLDQVEAIVAIDTIDTDAIRKQADDFEAAMNELMSTQEWQKMKDLSLDMSRLNDELMEGLSPLLNEQVIEVLEMKEITEMATRMMDDIDVDVDIDREELREVMEVRMKEMDVQMEELQLAMKEINLEGIQELQELAQMAAAEVQINAKELQIMSEKTRQMAEEVSVQADEIRAFNNRLISMLIADGYIDSKEDIDQIELREGIFYLNDEALKKKDQKKYLDLHQGYFGDDSFIFNFKN